MIGWLMAVASHTATELWQVFNNAPAINQSKNFVVNVNIWYIHFSGRSAHTDTTGQHTTHAKCVLKNQSPWPKLSNSFTAWHSSQNKTCYTNTNSQGANSRIFSAKLSKNAAQSTQNSKDTFPAHSVAGWANNHHSAEKPGRDSARMTFILFGRRLSYVRLNHNVIGLVIF